MIGIDYPAVLLFAFHILCSAGLLFPLLPPLYTDEQEPVFEYRAVP